MAKKTYLKVRLVPESKPDSPFFLFTKFKIFATSPIDLYALSDLVINI